MQQDRTGEQAATATEDQFAVEALDWFVRLQAEAGNPATARGFRDWLDGDPGRERAFAKVTSVWGAPEFLAASRNVADAASRVADERRQRRRSRAKQGAMVASLMMLAFGAAHLSDFSVWLRADYVTAVGERREIPLSDGSTVTLNTGSAVALNFEQGGRGVTLLQGEAFFDVARDTARPFKVSGRFGRVAVKGTAFSVRFDPQADTIVLSRGEVAVSRLSRPEDATSLKPGDAVSVTASALMPVRHVEPARSLEWLEGRISFSERPFGEVLDDLRRYYSGRVFLANGRLARVAVSGSYRLDEPEIAIRSLAEAAGAVATVLPGGIVILR
ncbi:iron dicitrate transport regulator FecR [Bosea sp. WAO]|uniref:FecR family protein n=1 Tax=Bosea sp. WAO TaxID=406341 RepID=UPI0007497093|nr:FecR domain-containing protein [Bosea sp. WAO]KUL94568.1 iron dicitrate transport regulator FecR [Bosea sp. WAO]